MTPEHLTRIYVDRLGFGEHNDCTVVALATAFEMPYPAAHKLMAMAGRKTRHICPTGIFLNSDIPNQIIGGFRYVRVGQDGTVSLAQFLRDFPKGRFVLHCRDHVFTVIDGKVFNLRRGRRTRIKTIWYLEAL